MAFNLNILFGGLCMIVQRDDPADKGLYVLMPATNDHDHDDDASPQHCPTLVVPHVHDPASAGDVLSAIPNGIDLRPLASATCGVLRPARVLNVSSVAGLPVDPSCFATPMPACLAQRIVLPLGSSMFPLGKQGDLNVPVIGSYPVTGFLQVTFEVTNAATLRIGPKMLVPANNEINLVMLNVPIAELQGYSRPTVATYPASHVDAYYPLLTPNCAPGSFRITHNVTKPGGIPSAPRACPLGDEPFPPPAPVATVVPAAPPTSMTVFGGVKMLGVDPNNCTIGYGCTTYPCP